MEKPIQELFVATFLKLLHCSYALLVSQVYGTPLSTTNSNDATQSPGDGLFPGLSHPHLTHLSNLMDSVIDGKASEGNIENDAVLCELMRTLNQFRENLIDATTAQL